MSFEMESLATVAGLAAAVKYLVVPLAKKLAPKLEGPMTTSVAVFSGVALSLAYRCVTMWPLSARGWLEAVLMGVIGGATAIGVQEISTAAFRPDKA